MEREPLILLEGSECRQRLLQQAIPALSGALIVAGIVALAVMHGTVRVIGGIAVIAGVAVGVLAFSRTRFLVAWEVTYKGHLIRFQNHPVYGERLLIDGEEVGRGGLGFRRVFHGTITNGEGAGDRITAESVAGLLRFRVRIVAESFRDQA